MDKRRFLKTSSFGLTASVLTPGEVLRSWLKSENPNQKKALVLGGRGFIGPSIVRGLMQAGYDVTLLNRGNTNPHLFQNLPLINCDRETENREGLRSVSDKIRTTNWDVVVDTWQKSSKAVDDFLSEFKDQIGHYHYISTISVYDKWDKKYVDEQVKQFIFKHFLPSQSIYFHNLLIIIILYLKLLTQLNPFLHHAFT